MPADHSHPRLSLPPIAIELVDDLSPPQTDGFMRLVRRSYRAHYPDGAVSEPFVLDAVHREALDAVVMAAHFADRDNRRFVYLRSAVRPALTLRDPGRHLEAHPPGEAGLWELPAGLVETEQQGSEEGVALTAQRELQEELGFSVPLARLRPLGPSIYPTPAIIAERHYFFEVEVDPAARTEPTLDGLPLERSGVVVAVELSQALAMCARGEIQESKTELGLRRLRERLA
jgi:ADP-ribose pyrophosphatase